MKKIFAIVALMLMSFLHLEAQTFMVNAIVPKERSKCNISKSNESAFVLGGYKVKGGLRWDPRRADLLRTMSPERLCSTSRALTAR